MPRRRDKMRSNALGNRPNPPREPAQALRELARMQRMLREAHLGDTSGGRRNYPSVHEAAEHLGLGPEQQRHARKLISEVARDTRDMLGVVRKARELGFERHEIKEIIHRGHILADRLRRGESIGDESLYKAESKGKPKGKPKGKDKPKDEGEDGKSEIDPGLLARYNALHAHARSLRHPLKIEGELKPGHTHAHLDRLHAKIKEHERAQRAYEPPPQHEHMDSAGGGGGEPKGGKPAKAEPPKGEGELAGVHDLVQELEGAMPLARTDAERNMLDELHRDGEDLSDSASPETVAWYRKRVKHFLDMLHHRDHPSAGGDDEMAKARRGGGAHQPLGAISQHSDGTYAVKVSEDPGKWEEFSTYDKAIARRKQVMAGTAGPMVSAPQLPGMGHAVGEPVISKAEDEPKLMVTADGHVVLVRKALTAGHDIINPRLVREAKEKAKKKKDEAKKSEHRDRMPGGLGDKLKPEDVDQDQLAEGISVEMEHTNSRATAREIALDHLAEDPRYYTKLRRVEGKKVKKGLRATHPVNEYGHRDDLVPGMVLEHHRGPDVLVKGGGRFEMGGITFLNGKELLNEVYGHSRHGMTVRRYFKLGTPPVRPGLAKTFNLSGVQRPSPGPQMPPAGAAPVATRSTPTNPTIATPAARPQPAPAARPQPKYPMSGPAGPGLPAKPAAPAAPVQPQHAPPQPAQRPTAALTPLHRHKPGGYLREFERLHPKRQSAESNPHVTHQAGVRGQRQAVHKLPIHQIPPEHYHPGMKGNADHPGPHADDHDGRQRQINYARVHTDWQHKHGHITPEQHGGAHRALDRHQRALDRDRHAHMRRYRSAVEAHHERQEPSRPRSESPFASHKPRRQDRSLLQQVNDLADHAHHSHRTYKAHDEQPVRGGREGRADLHHHAGEHARSLREHADRMRARLEKLPDHELRDLAHQHADHHGDAPPHGSESKRDLIERVHGDTEHYTSEFERRHRSRTRSKTRGQPVVGKPKRPAETTFPATPTTGSRQGQDQEPKTEPRLGIRKPKPESRTGGARDEDDTPTSTLVGEPKRRAAAPKPIPPAPTKTKKRQRRPQPPADEADTARHFIRERGGSWATSGGPMDQRQTPEERRRSRGATGPIEPAPTKRKTPKAAASSERSEDAAPKAADKPKTTTAPTPPPRPADTRPTGGGKSHAEHVRHLNRLMANGTIGEGRGAAHHPVHHRGETYYVPTSRGGGASWLGGHPDGHHLRIHKITGRAHDHEGNVVDIPTTDEERASPYHITRGGHPVTHHKGPKKGQPVRFRKLEHAQTAARERFHSETEHHGHHHYHPKWFTQGHDPSAPMKELARGSVKNETHPQHASKDKPQPDPAPRAQAEAPAARTPRPPTSAQLGIRATSPQTPRTPQTRTTGDSATTRQSEQQSRRAAQRRRKAKGKK